MSTKMVSEIGSIYELPLTRSEIKVLLMITRGMQQGEVAKALRIQPDTVSRHMSNSHKKLKAASTQEALRKAGIL